MYIVLTIIVIKLAAVLAFGLKEARMEGPKCPYPPIYPFVPGPLNLSLGDLHTPGANLVYISQNSQQGGGIATGLDNLVYRLERQLLKISFTMALPGTSCVKGDSYRADGTVDFSPFTDLLFPSGSFRGTGFYNACITDVRMAGHVQLGLNWLLFKPTVSELKVYELQFSSVSVDLDEFYVNKERINWTMVNTGLKKKFDKEWPPYGDGYLERCRAAANYIIEQYTILELIAMMDSKEEADCSKFLAQSNTLQ